MLSGLHMSRLILFDFTCLWSILQLTERLSANTLLLMKRDWHLPWRYLEMCSFRFYPAARVKIANFAVWCPYNESISVYKLRELPKNFGSVFTVAKAPLCWNLIRKAFLLHSKDFRVLVIADLLYGIPILARDQGLIGETNVRHIEMSVIRVKPFYNII